MRRGDAKPRRAARLKTDADRQEAGGLSPRAFPAKRRTKTRAKAALSRGERSGSGEALRCAGPGAFCLDLAVLRRSRRDQRVEQALGGGGDLVDGPVERVLVRAGRLGEAADLAHVLEGRVPDLVLRGWGLEVEERMDIPAHINILCAG